MTERIVGAQTRRFGVARTLVASILLVAASGLVTDHVARSAPTLTDRGLDFYLHGSNSGAAGETLSVNVQALGFPTSTTLAPLPNAVFEATWDPESLVVGEDTPKTVPPPTSRVTADAEGRATLKVPIPPGVPATIKLLVRAQAGDRERTRELMVQRTKPDDLALFVSDTRVVPGSSVVVWALWTSADGSHPRAGGPVAFTLSQGGIERFRRVVQTDAAGAAMVSMIVPRDEDPLASWVVRAEAAGTANSGQLASSTTLQTREEVPGRASVTSFFEEPTVMAGGKAKYRVRLLDASGQAITGKPVWVWTGPKGTAAPEDDEEFRKVAKRGVTDGAGEIAGEIVAPSTIPLRGTSVTMEAQVELEGQLQTTQSVVDVRRKRGHVRLAPEAGELVPGLEQRLTIELWGDDGNPLIGTFAVKGDGLDSTFTTDAKGLGEVMWKVPNGAGAFRSRGPCPETVAAQVSVRAAPKNGEPPAFEGELGDAMGSALCVPVHRDATLMARTSKVVVAAGEKVPVTIFGAQVAGPNGSQQKRASSVLITEHDGGRVTGQWETTDTAVVEIPADASGPVTVSISAPRLDGKAETVTTSMLVVPSSLPKLSGERAGGRAVPGGTVKVTARLVDSSGKPMSGSVAAVLIDKFGGGSLGRLQTMDTRYSLCSAVGEYERCDELLLGGPEADPLRRARISGGPAVLPTHDPAGTAKQEMDATFANVVRSLEGAVYEASMTPETLPDVRRKEGGKYVFNPELMTLVTDAMSARPLTPGGEAVSLADIIAIDPQVTYDSVARRITRLKMFDVLNILRTGKLGMDSDEPIFADPNVFLRKLMKEGMVSEAQLLDPWGGRFSFFKGGKDPVPFVTVTRGWELRSPGPDGKLGTADDVVSPFERVLKTGTPYADAVKEDVVVDARWDMQVSDATVAKWQQTFLTLTGTQIGDSYGAGGIGLSGMGEGGGGQGFGVGLGSVGTIGRGSYGLPKGLAYTSMPKRTDEDGRVTFDIPLGDIETTWMVGLVGLPDDGRPAVTTVDIPSDVPMSTKIAAGASWTDGDQGDVVIEVRNRTAKDAKVTLSLAAQGAIALEGGQSTMTVEVGSQGLTPVRVRVRAGGHGAGRLQVKATADGLPDDLLTHTIIVKPRGELMRIARTVWVSDESDLFDALNRPPFTPVGGGELVLDRGDHASLVAALESMHPEENLPLDDLVELALASATLEKHFVAREGQASVHAVRAKEIGLTASARVAARMNDEPQAFSYRGRLAWAGHLGERQGADVCPQTDALASRRAYAAAMDAEPQPKGGVVSDCWAVFAPTAVNQLLLVENPASLARAIVAYARRPHRRVELTSLSKKFFELVDPKNEGRISLAGSPSRSDRALVYAAALLATDPNERKEFRTSMVKWLMVQRDASGSFGSGAATRAAVEAMVRESSYSKTSDLPLTVEVDFGEGGVKKVTLQSGEVLRLAVPDGATKLEVAGEGVLARLERDFLRSYDTAPQRGEPTAEIDVQWPTAPPCSTAKTPSGSTAAMEGCVQELRAGFVGTLRVSLSNAGLASSTIVAKVPLPPGVGLAGAIPGVHQVQGALYIVANNSGDLLIPLRFGLAGSFTVREATARVSDMQGDSGIARARPLVVKPNAEPK